MEKGEFADNQNFLLFPHCFLPYQREALSYKPYFKLSSANAVSLDESIILLLVEELTCLILLYRSDGGKNNQHLHSNKG